MIKGGACPVACAVTRLTSRRELGLRVVRIRCAVVVGLMALHAASGSGEVIRPAGTERGVVALRALQGNVSAIQGEPGRRMVEGGATPTGGVVALLTGCREIRLHVVGVRSAIEISLMTLHARSRSGQVICPARAEGGVVALRALLCRVRTS